MGTNITPEIQAIINAAITQYIRENLSQRSEPSPPGPLGEAGADGANGSSTSRNSHLKLEDIGFFDNLFVCKGPVGTENNRTVFRDIDDRLKDIAATSVGKFEPGPSSPGPKRDAPSSKHARRWLGVQNALN